MLYEIQSENGHLFKVSYIPDQEESAIKEVIANYGITLGSVKETTILDIEGIGNLSIYPIFLTKNYLGEIKSVLPKNRSFFHAFAKNFVKFVQWVLHLHPSKPLKELEVAFAMHLFRNTDQEVFEKLTGKKGETPSLPLSGTLKIWNNFFEEVMEMLPEGERETISEFLPKLKTLQALEDELEKIRTIKKQTKRVEAREQLTQRVLQQANEAFDREEAFYLPGGYLDSNKQHVPMIYELSREDGSIQFRAIDLSGTLSKTIEPTAEELMNAEFQQLFALNEPQRKEARIAPSVEMELLNLESFVDKALRAQVGPQQYLKRKKRGFFGILKVLFTGIERDEEERERQQLVRNLQERRNVTPSESEVTTKEQTAVDAEKLMEVFLKVKAPDLYKTKKTLLKISSFLALYRQADRKLNDPKVRHWMRSNAIALLESIEKIEHRMANEDLEYLKGELEEVLNDLKTREKGFVAHPPSPSVQGKSRTAFSQKVGSSELKSLSEFKTTSIKGSNVSPLDAVPFDDPVECLEALKTQFARIEETVEQKEWKNSEMLLEDFSHHLNNMKTAIEGWNLNVEQAEEWSELLRNFGFLATEVNYGLGFVAPKPNFIHYLLQSLAITDLLCRTYEETGVYQEFQLDMDPVHDVLRDPYVNLGASAEGIEKSLSLIKKDPSLRSTSFPFRQFDYFSEGREQSLFGKLNAFHNPGNYDIPDDARLDFGELGALPPQILHVRQLYQLTLTLLAPTRMLKCDDITQFLAATLVAFIETSNEGVSPIEKVAEKSTYVILDEIRKKRGKISFHNKLILSEGVKFPTISPWEGLPITSFYENRRTDYYGLGGIHLGRDNRFGFEHPRIYKEHGIAVEDKKVENNLFKQQVGVFNDPHVNDHGVPVAEEWFGLAGKTQFSILREKLLIGGLPSDIVQELELMETDMATRLKETVGKLSKYASLLNNGKIAPMLRRLFAHNFTRDNLLIHQLVNEPEYTPILIKILEETALQQRDAHHYTSYLFLVNLLYEIHDSFDVIREEVDDHKQWILEENAEKLRTLLDGHNDKIQELQERADQKRSPEIKYQRDFHFHSLLFLAKELKNIPDPTIDTETLIECLKSYAILQISPETEGVPPDQQLQIDYLIHRLKPQIQDVLQRGEVRNAIGNHLLQFLKPSVTEPLEWEISEDTPLLIHSGNYLLNLEEGTLWEENTRTAKLPGSIQKHHRFQKIATLLKNSGFEKPLETVSTTITQVESAEERGIQYAFTLDEHAFRLILTDNNALHLYKKEGHHWFQLQEEFISEPPPPKKEDALKVLSTILSEMEKHPPAPRALNKYDCWVDASGNYFRAEKNGKLVFSGTLEDSPKSIREIQEVETGKQLLNPWKKGSFGVFQHLDPSSQILTLGKRGKVNEVRYNRFNLTYTWDRNEKQWISSQHKNYYLSNRSLAACFKQPEEEDASVLKHTHPLEELFSSSFHDYHLLESDRGHPKVLLSGKEYKKEDAENKISNKRLEKRNRKLYAELKIKESEEIPLFTYTADPRKGMVCDDAPDGYLYLAYVLLAQGKYDEALHYLKKGDLGRPLSLQGQTIIEWIRANSDHSPEATAFNLHLSLLLMRQAAFTQPGAPQDLSVQRAVASAAEQYRIYNELVEKGKIKESLQFSPSDHEDFARFSEKSLFYVARKVIGYQLEIEAAVIACRATGNDVPLQELMDEIPDLRTLNLSPMELKRWHEEGLLELGPQEFVEALITFEQKTELRMRVSYRSEIEELEALIHVQDSLDKVPLPPEGALEALIPVIEDDYTDYFTLNESGATGIDWIEKAAQFNDEVMGSLKTAYAQEIREELHQDLTESTQPTEKRQQFNMTHYNTCLSQVKEGERQSLKEAQEHKRVFFALLPEKQLRDSEWRLLLRRAREQNISPEQVLFDTALRCAGENDWSFFPSMNEEAKAICRDHLKAAVRMQQYTRVKEALHNLAEAKQGTEKFLKKSEEAYNLIHTGWAYDPDHDPDALSFLLVEYELGFICRPSQVEVVRTSLHKENQFKQEICGGGKTTVLRNVIAHFRADGTTLSAVSTLSPLRQEHGMLFSRTTRHAFGQKSIDFVFSRATPSDETSLLKLHRNLLKMIVERGRIDLTKEDLLSFKLEIILKQELIMELNPDNPKWETLNRELDVMENIRDLLKTRAKINADELDKDCDPTQEKNYAHGQRGSFHPKKIAAGTSLLRYLLTAQEETPHLKILKQAVQSNQQFKLSKEEIALALEELAGLIFDDCKGALGLEEKHHLQFIEYMTTENASDEIVQFYDRYVAPTDHNHVKEIVCFMHEFMTQILPHSFNKKGGVDFCRSEDLVHVIPSEGNDSPKEGSEHAQESEQIWYALLDYADLSRDLGGVSTDQIQQTVYTSKKAAIKEIEESRQTTPDAPKIFEETEAAQRFYTSFHCRLSEISAEEFPAIAETITRDPDQLIEFLEEWVFPEYQQNSEKIVADAQDPPSMVQSYSGSSGTDHSKYALPDAIDSSDARQPGVHAEVIRSLMASEEHLSAQGIDSFLTYTETSPIIIADHPSEDAPPTLLQTLAQEIKGGDCLSDVGVAFPGVSSVDLARSLQQLLPEPKLVIRFMNRSNEWKMLINGKVVPVDPNLDRNEVFTIFDDTHTRGAERPSTEGVTEYVTIDEQTALSKFEQGVLRERGVTKGEATVRYLIAPSLYEKLGDPPSLNALFAKLIENEASHLKALNLKAEKQKIRAIARHGIETALRSMSKESRQKGSSEHHSARALIHQYTRRYFIQSTEAHAASAGSPSQLMGTGMFLEQLAKEEFDKVKNLVSDLKALHNPLINDFCKKLEIETASKLRAKMGVTGTKEHKGRIDDRLIPESVPNHEMELDNDVAVEQQMEVEQEQEQEKQAQVQGTPDFEEVPYEQILRKYQWSPSILIDYLENSTNKGHFQPHYPVIRRELHPFATYAPHLSSNKFFTRNFCPILGGEDLGIKPWGVLSSEEQIPPEQNKVSRTVFIIDIRGDTPNVYEILPSLKDHDDFFHSYVTEYEKDPVPGIFISTYNYDAGCVDEGASWDDFTPDIAKLLNREIVSTKFFDGEVNYPEFKGDTGDAKRNIQLNQFGALVEWIVNNPAPIDALEYSFKAFIKAHRSSKVYKGSDIERAFKVVRGLKW